MIQKQLNIQTNYGEIHISREEAQRQLEEVSIASKAAWEDANFVEWADWTNQREAITLQQLYIPRNKEKNIRTHLENTLTPFLIVVGDAGNGKTSLLWRLFSIYETSNLFSPLFIKALSIRKLPLLGAIQALFAQNRKPLILLDTIDILLHNEADRDDLLRFLFWLKEKGCALVTTSRIQEANTLPNELRLKKEQLNNYDDATELPKAIEKHVAKYYQFKHTKAQQEYVQTIQQAVSKGKSLTNICQNPLTLRMLFTIYAPEEIPEEINVFQLYQNYWRKRVVEDKRAGTFLKNKNDVSSLNLKEAACIIALLMLAEGQPDIHISKASTYFDQLQIPIEYIDLLASRGIVKRSHSNLSFFHQTFFEHSAARALQWKKWQKAIDFTAQKVLVKHNKLANNDLFLVPIYEHLLLLNQFTFQKRVEQATLELMDSNHPTEITSGIYVYALLEQYSQQLDANIEAKITQHFSTSTILSFLDIASNIPQARISTFFQKMQLIWEREKWREQHNVIELLERFAGSYPELILDFYKKNDLLSKLLITFTNKHGQVQKKSILKEVVNTMIKIATKFPDQSWEKLLYIYKRGYGYRTYGDVLMQIYKYRHLFSIRRMTTKIEQAILPKINTKKRVKSEMYEYVILTFRQLWLQEWREEKYPSQKIIEELSTYPFMVCQKSRLHALARYAPELSHKEAKTILDAFKAQNNQFELFKWAKTFLRELLPLYTKNAQTPIFQLFVNDIGNVLEEWLTNSKTTLSKQTNMHAIAYIEAFKGSTFYQNGLEMVLSQVPCIQENSNWFRLHALGNNLNFFMDLFIEAHCAQFSSALYTLQVTPPSFFNENPKVTQRFIVAIFKRQNKSAALHSYGLQLLIATKNIYRINVFLEDILNPKSQQYKVIPSFLQEFGEELDNLVQDSVRFSSPDERRASAKLWGYLLDLSLVSIPDASTIIGLLESEPYYLTKSEIMPLLEKVKINTLEIFNQTLQSLENFLHHKDATLRNKSQTIYLEIALRNSYPIPPEDKVLRIILMDFELTFHYHKIAYTATLVERLMETNFSKSIEMLTQFFTSQEVENLSNHQKYKIPHIYKRTFIILLKSADITQRRHFVQLIPKCNDQVGRLIVNSFYYERSLYQSVEAELNELLQNENVHSDVKKVISKQQKYKLRVMGNSGWNEIYDLIVN